MNTHTRTHGPDLTILPKMQKQFSILFISFHPILEAMYWKYNNVNVMF